jgi:hypothetical protein
MFLHVESLGYLTIFHSDQVNHFLLAARDKRYAVAIVQVDRFALAPATRSALAVEAERMTSALSDRFDLGTAGATG